MIFISGLNDLDSLAKIINLMPVCDALPHDYRAGVTLDLSPDGGHRS